MSLIRPIRIVSGAVLVALACTSLLAESGSQPAPQPAGTDAADAETNPLDRIISRMRLAQERIQNKDTGEQTRELQQQVVSDLEKLIELAKQMSSNRSQQSPQRNPQQSAGEDSENKQDKSQQKQAVPRPAGPDKKDNAASPQARSPEDEKRAAQLLDQRGTAAVWGHLPEKLRDELRNVAAGKTLSKYSDLVRRYYQALAEQNKNPPREERRSREN
ncbi:MAG: hypothetical protein WD648_15015 [Planctomycetaceae bacterium]